MPEPPHVRLTGCVPKLNVPPLAATRLASVVWRVVPVPLAVKVALLPRLYGEVMAETSN